MKLTISRDKLADAGLAVGQIFFGIILVQPIVAGDISIFKVVIGSSLSIIGFAIGILIPVKIQKYE